MPGENPNPSSQPGPTPGELPGSGTPADLQPGGLALGADQQPGSGQPGPSDTLEFRYSENTPMTEFFKDYPQYAENPNFNKYKTTRYKG